MRRAKSIRFLLNDTCQYQRTATHAAYVEAKVENYEAFREINSFLQNFDLA